MDETRRTFYEVTTTFKLFTARHARLCWLLRHHFCGPFLVVTGTLRSAYMPGLVEYAGAEYLVTSQGILLSRRYVADASL